MRPKQPKFTDHNDPHSYYNLNRYYNEAEKIFDKIEKWLRRAPQPRNDKFFSERYMLLGLDYYRWFAESSEFTNNCEET